MAGEHLRYSARAGVVTVGNVDVLDCSQRGAVQRRVEAHPAGADHGNTPRARRQATERQRCHQTRAGRRQQAGIEALAHKLFGGVQHQQLADRDLAR